jgi:hypothetical protein
MSGCGEVEGVVDKGCKAGSGGRGYGVVIKKRGTNNTQLLLKSR